METVTERCRCALGVQIGIQSVVVCSELTVAVMGGGAFVFGFSAVFGSMAVLWGEVIGDG